MKDPFDTKPRLPVQVRWMNDRDRDAVLAIERQSFSPGERWEEKDFDRCKRQSKCIGMVAEDSDRIVGYVVYRTQAKSLEVLNIAVDPQYRRRGVASQMVDKLVGKLPPQNRTGVVAKVRQSNRPAQELFRNKEFRASDYLREFYDDTPEDGYRMQYRLGKTASNQTGPFTVREDKRRQQKPPSKG